MKIKLDKEEQELLELFENDQLTTSKDSVEKKILLKKAAAKHLKKEKRIKTWKLY